MRPKRHIFWLTRDLLLLRPDQRIRRLLNTGNLPAAPLYLPDQGDWKVSCILLSVVTLLET
jgi:hypothetical protein